MTADRSLTLIPLGHAAGAYGLKGEIRIFPLQDGTALLSSQRWFYTPVNSKEPQQWILQAKARRHSSWILAHPQGINSKEEADRIKGTVYMLREDFPAIDEADEHWAVDVIGCRCVNMQGEILGIVKAIGTNGVQDILEVGKLEETKSRYLIPMVDAYLKKIDTQAKIVTVDWQADWS